MLQHQWMIHNGQNVMIVRLLDKIVDYVMLMAYDEHWRTSPVSGSVASLPWVENGVVNTLKDVPNEKLR